MKSLILTLQKNAAKALQGSRKFQNPPPKLLKRDSQVPAYLLSQLLSRLEQHRHEAACTAWGKGSDSGRTIGAQQSLNVGGPLIIRTGVASKGSIRVTIRDL